MKKINRTFVKYFISFFLVYLIPVLVLGAMLYWNAVHELRDEIEALNLDKLSQIKLTLEEDLRGLEQTAGKMSFDPRLTPYMVTGNAYTKREAIDELGKYKINSPFADELFLYLKRDDFIYSSTGSSSLTTFTNNMYLTSRASELVEQLRDSSQTVLKAERGIIFGNDEDQNMISYMVPVPVKSHTSYGSVLFVINEKRIKQLIENVLGDYTGAVYIVDEGKNIVAKSSAGYMEEEAIDHLVASPLPSGLSEQTWNRASYSVAVNQSDMTGWTLLLMMPTEQFFGKVMEVRTLFYGLIAILVIAGLSTAFLISRLHYRPIRELTHYSRLVGDSRSTERGASEFEHIRHVLDDAIAQHRSLETEMKEQLPIVREKMLTRLLKGTLRDEAELRQSLLANGIQMLGPLYFVLYVSWDEAASGTLSGDYEEIVRALSFVEVDRGAAYGVELAQEHVISLIISISGEMAKSRPVQERVVSQLYVRMEQLARVRPIVGVSNLYERLAAVNRGFIEASAAHSYHWKLGKEKPIYFDDIKSMHNNYEWYPVENQLRFLQSLRQGDQVVAGEMLSAIIEDLKTNASSFLLLKSISSEMINTVMKTLSELSVPDYSRYAKELISTASLDDLEQKLRNLIVIVCGHVEQIRESNNLSLRNSVLNYVHEHFQEYDFSLDKVSDQFRVSSSYLGRFIKDQTGYTFMDYVTYLKMEEVKDSLIHTDQTIQEIIERVGYQNMSSFIRKFKALEGVTPGRYRTLYASTKRD